MKEIDRKFRNSDEYPTSKKTEEIKTMLCTFEENYLSHRKEIHLFLNNKFLAQ